MVDEGSQKISEAHFFAATMQRFGVKPAVYNPKVCQIKETHHYLTEEVSLAGLHKHKNFSLSFRTVKWKQM